MALREKDLELLAVSSFEDDLSSTDNESDSSYSYKSKIIKLGARKPSIEESFKSDAPSTLDEIIKKYGIKPSLRTRNSSVFSSGTSTPTSVSRTSSRTSLNDDKFSLSLDEVIKRYGLKGTGQTDSSCSTSRSQTPTPENFENTGFGRMSITISPKASHGNTRFVDIKSVNVNNIPKVLDSHGGMFSEDEEDDEAESRKTIENFTLDQIIRENQKKKEESEDFDSQFVNKLMHLIRDKPTLSSLALLKVISESETGETVQMECFELLEKSIRPNDYRANRWRVQFSYGDKLQGVGAAPRKLMAKYIAALHLIEKLRTEYPDLEIPSCQIPEGCLINPFIFTLLKRECEAANLPMPIYEIAELITENKDENLFIVNCKVGEAHIEGCGLSKNNAMRFAAKAAYEQLTGRKFKYDRIIAGEYCIGETQYVLGDAESMTTITIPGITHLPRSFKRESEGKEEADEEMDEDEDKDFEEFKRPKFTLKRARLTL